MQEYLKSSTWPEKIESVERMNEAARIAREAMRNARAKEATSPQRGSSNSRAPQR